MKGLPPIEQTCEAYVASTAETLTERVPNPTSGQQLREHNDLVRKAWLAGCDYGVASARAVYAALEAI
ncbi:MAG: hypothetical protein ACRD3Q_18590 [Terriglobales bacterium]